MDIKRGFEVVSDFLGSLIDLLASLVAVGVLAEVLFGTGVFGASVVTNLTSMIAHFGTHGFAGLLSLLILVGLYQRRI
ncbi:MAG: hypothetical protein ACI9S8_002615 [Chlamydiales bacterium]|jgi:hypothetical protein